MPQKILLQLDSDSQPSVFDSIVAIDAGVEQLLRHGNVEADQVRDLVHGCIFTRKPSELSQSAIFIGGSHVEIAEELYSAALQAFFGPMRVSILFDANGCNTTAAAAVLAAKRHLNLSETTAVVLGGTGPVGIRVSRLLAQAGATVRVGSRHIERAATICATAVKRHPKSSLTPVVTNSPSELAHAITDCQLVIAAGAAGVQFFQLKAISHQSLKVAIDLNAVPPVGIEGISPQDQATEKRGTICYGAIGIGGTKMKIHRAAVAQLFSANTWELDAEQILEIGLQLGL